MDYLEVETCWQSRRADNSIQLGPNIQWHKTEITQKAIQEFV